MVLKTMLNDSKKVLAISLLSVAFSSFLDFRSGRKTVHRHVLHSWSVSSGSWESVGWRG
jgi:hypothetical protein